MAPIWTAPKAQPKSSTTSVGKATKYFYDEPTQCSGFSVCLSGLQNYIKLGMFQRGLRIDYSGMDGMEKVLMGMTDLDRKSVV